MGKKLPNTGRSRRQVGENVVRTIARRRWRIIAILTAALLAGFVTHLLLSDAPRDAFFLPLFVSTYEAPGIPTTPFAENDVAAIAGPFKQPVSISSQAGHRMVQALAGLKHRPAHHPVVVYVTAQALRDDAGAIHVLPADALPHQPDTWLPLQTVLTKLRDCPARHKLLILDIVRSVPPTRPGAVEDDIAAGIEAELKAVPDSGRLVLCACAPGQRALASPEMGRSVFAYYVEEGLRGHANSGASLDRWITVRELAAFVRARVDRWARLNRGTRQTPLLLGSDQDFSLIAVQHPSNADPSSGLPTPAYPETLAGGWEQRDQFWDSGAYRLAPPAFHKLQTLLQAAEADWRAGIDLGRIHHSRLAGVRSLRHELSAAADAGAKRPELPAEAYTADLFQRSPDVFPWIKDQLAHAAQARHDADVRALAEGFVAREEIEEHAWRARDLDEKLQDAGRVVDCALAALDQAHILLPLLGRCPALMGDAKPAWNAAAKELARLAAALEVQPATTTTLGAIEKHTQALQVSLAALNRPFLPDNFARLHALASTDSRPETVMEIEALLSIPHPLVNAGQRKRLWRIRSEIAGRLLQRTRELDRLDNETGQSPTETDPPAPEKDRKRWLALGRSNTDIDESKPLDRLRVHTERSAAFQRWLAEHYRHLATDLEGLGLTTPAAVAARRLYADAAAVLNLAASDSSKLEIHTPVRAGWLSEKHRTTRLVVEVRPLTADAGNIDVHVLRPDGIGVRREVVALPVGRGAKGATGTQLLPLQVRLQRDAASRTAVRPRGVFFELALAGRHFHHVEPLRILEPGREFRVFLSDSLTNPKPASSVRLQTDAEPKCFKLCVENPAPEKLRAIIKMNVGDGFQTVGRAEFDGRTIQPIACSRVSNRVAQKTVELQLVDANDPETVLDRVSVPVEVRPKLLSGVAAVTLDLNGPLRAGTKSAIPMHLRNAPPGAVIEAAMAPAGGQRWTVLTRHPAQDLEVSIHGEDGELAFSAALRQHATFVDLRNHKGRGRLRVRLLSASERVLDEATGEVTVRDPLLPGTGSLAGTVKEGPLPQPGLTVILRDSRGNEKARATTGPDGAYLFENVLPGRYTVFCSKPTSRRQAVSPTISVRPEKETTANLSLSL